MERYVPQHSPTIEALERELYRIRAALDALVDGEHEVNVSAPARPVYGQELFADGTYWDPGFGAGLYLYTGTSTASATWQPQRNTIGWDDLKFPAQGINPAGAAAPPVYSTTQLAFEFTANADNVIAGVAQMPHGWAIGTEIRPHIHIYWLSTPAAGTKTKWRFSWRWYNVHETISTTIKISDIEYTLGAANVHNILPFSAIAGTSKRLSSIIKWSVTRLGASASDSYSDAIYLDEFDIHYQTDAFGSRAEYSK